MCLFFIDIFYWYHANLYLTWWLTTLYVLQGNNGKHWGLQDGTNIIPCLFVFLCPISNIEKIFMHILVFRPFQSSSLMITSQTTSMVRRRGRFSYNTHGSILKCSWRGWRMDGQSSTGTGLKLQRPSTWMKAQYSPSASAVFQMRCICLYTVYDANFERFYMLHVKLGAGAVV